MVEIKWADTAKSDLKGTIEYLFYDSPQYAEYFYERIFESIDKLKSFPEIERQILKLKDPI